jgi:hypothetical protein
LRGELQPVLGGAGGEQEQVTSTNDRSEVVVAQQNSEVVQPNVEEI